MLEQRIMGIDRSRLKSYVHELLSFLYRFRNRIVSRIDFIKYVYRSELELFIDSLTNVYRLGYYNNIANDVLNTMSNLGENYVNTRIIQSYIKRLMKSRVVPVAKINYLAIGLFILIIHIPREIKPSNIPYREWLLYYSMTLEPYGTLLVYYIPISYLDYLVSSIKNQIMKNGDGIKVYLFEKGERLQPCFSNMCWKLQHTTDHIYHLFTGYKYDELKNIYTNIEKLHTKLEEKDNFANMRLKPNDLIDLILLKEFQYNAFKLVTDISKEFSIPYRSVKKHLEKHLIKWKLIEGIFLPLNIFTPLIRKYKLIYMSFRDPESYWRTLLFFKNIAYTISIYRNIGLTYENKLDLTDNSEHDMLITILEPMEREYELYRFIYKESANIGLEEFQVFNPSITSSMKYSIPYTNFDQEAKDWTINTEETYKLYLRRISARL